MRLRKVKNVEEKIKEYDGFIIFDPTLYKGKWHSLFNNNNPIHIEIGMGKGKFIKTMCEKNENINYIGIELSESIVYKACKTLHETKNLKVINYDAFNLDKVFEKGEVDKIYLNFSDPWPKSRHEKRRLTSDSFLSVYEMLLDKGKEIQFKTDNRGLFEYSVKTFNNKGYEIVDISFDLHNSDIENYATTEYEDRFSNMGNVIYYIRLKVK